MTCQYQPLEIVEYNLDDYGSFESDTHCEIHIAVDTALHKPIVVQLTWEMSGNTTSNKSLYCIATQLFLSDDLDRMSEEDVKQIIEFSNKELKSAIKDRLKSQGCTILTMRPELLSEKDQLRQILQRIKAAG